MNTFSTLPGLRRVFAAALVLLVAAATASGSEPVEQHSFAEFLGSTTILPLTGQAGDGGILPKNILLDDLTDAEQRMVSLTVLSDELNIGCTYTLLRAVSAYNRTGTLPANGYELMLMDCCGGSKTEDEIIEQLAGLDEAELIQKVGMYVNPATGRFYESFGNPDWHRLGVYIEKVEGDHGLKLMPISRKTQDGGTETEMVPHRTYRIVVFGESADRVLVDKVVWFIEN